MKFIFFLLSILSVFSVEAGTLSVNTDLGHFGNSDVANSYNLYKKNMNGKGCQTSGPGHRVILTGFGLFSGVNYNISGAVISSLGDSEFFPDTIDLSQHLPTPAAAAQDGILRNSLYGVKITNRELKINDKLFEVCFITVNVQWDLAAAFFINEATNFKPELIVMSGRGGRGVSIEVGALNNATQSSGFDSFGNPLSNNKPIMDQSVLLNDYEVNTILPLTWDTQKIADNISTMVADLGEDLFVQKSARFDNNYICNNVSFVLAHASQNKETSLAGGKLILPNPHFSIQPKVGFFHFPAVDQEYPDLKNYQDQIFAWTKIIAQTLYSQF